MFRTSLPFLCALLVALGVQTNANAQLTIGNTELDTLTVFSGLDTPWEMVWGPDNHIWLTERFGQISRFNPQTGSRDILLNIDETVTQVGEGGMLGLALHPDFPADNRLYVVYTYLDQNDAIKERLVVYHYDDDVLKAPETLIEGIEGNSTHNGSRLVFGPDRKLYMTTGDAQNQQAPQLKSNLNGKILRINADGSIPADNPDANSYVYSYGHRNAQGLCFGPSDKLYSSEHGPSNDDELNIILPDANYGWPLVEGYCDTPAEETECTTKNLTEPILAWTPTLAVSDVEYYNSDAIPELKGALLMATLKEKDVRALFLSEDGLSIDREEIHFDKVWNRLRAVCIAPDGSIYVSNSRSNWGPTSTSFNHQIIKIFNPAVQSVPAIPDGKNFSAYPNPFRERLRIDVKQGLDDANFAVIDAAGNSYYSGTKAEVNAYLNSAQCKSGTYFLTMEFGDDSWKMKLIKAEN